MNREVNLPKLVGKAILLASISSSLGAIEMSSRFSVLNFSKDQETLQNAANALTSYIAVATFWAIGTMLVLYTNYGWLGMALGLFFNGIIMGWIIVSYKKAFTSAAKKYNLQEPKLFQSII